MSLTLISEEINKMKKQFVRSAYIAVFGLALTMASSVQSATFNYTGSMTDAAIGGTSLFSMSLNGDNGDILSLSLTFDTNWNFDGVPGVFDPELYVYDPDSVIDPPRTWTVDPTTGALGGAINFFSSNFTACDEQGYDQCRIVEGGVLTFTGSNLSFTGTESRVLNGGVAETRGVDFAGSVVPIPAAVWLFGSGLVGLIGVARRKKA